MSDEIKNVQFNPAEPVWAIMHQTPARNQTSYFTGEGAEEEAHAQAESIARTTKRPVFVFGPQIAAYGAPPPERASRIPLGF